MSHVQSRQWTGTLQEFVKAIQNLQNDDSDDDSAQISSNCIVPQLDILIPSHINSNVFTYYDLNNKEHRQSLCKNIMRQLREDNNDWTKIPSDNSTNVMILRGKHITKQDKTIVDDINWKLYLLRTFVYELLVHSNELYLSLHVIHRKLNQSISSHAYLKKFNFVATYYIAHSSTNKLLLKYFVCERFELWKLFFNTIMTSLIRYVKWNGNKNLIDTLSATIDYWEERHFLHILNAQSLSLSNVIHTHLTNKNNIWKGVERDVFNMEIDVFKSTDIYKSISQKLWHLCTSMFNHCATKISDCLASKILHYCKIEDELVVLKLRGNDAKSGSKTLSKCRWIKCYNLIDLVSNKLYKCKGCQLVLYCCRNHQKKDWKYMHSSQCTKKYI